MEAANPAREVLEKARAARGAGDVRTCEALSSAAVRYAVELRDGEAAYHAAACAGRARLARGEPEIAFDHFREALELAKEWLPPRWLGPAYHDLYLATREAGASLAAQRYAGTASDLYRSFNGPDAPGLTGLYADVVQHAADRNPDCTDLAVVAVRAWEKVPERPVIPLYAFNAHAQTMRAAVTLRDRATYDAATEQAVHARRYMLPDGEHVARTLVYMAETALLNHDFVRAEAWGEEAERMAKERGETRIESEARGVRSAALAESAVPPA